MTQPAIQSRTCYRDGKTFQDCFSLLTSNGQTVPFAAIKRIGWRINETHPAISLRLAELMAQAIHDEDDPETIAAYLDSAFTRALEVLA